MFLDHPRQAPCEYRLVVSSPGGFIDFTRPAAYHAAQVFEARMIGETVGHYRILEKPGGRRRSAP